ncbi:MAG: hypothetical protein R2844_11850 [Caldilineales bacterium]
MTSLDPVVIREALAGYQAANDVIEAERRANLAQTTSAESWAQWRDLVSSFNARTDWHENLDRLDLWQVEGLLEIRRVLDLLADSQKAS